MLRASAKPEGLGPTMEHDGGTWPNTDGERMRRGASSSRDGAREAAPGRLNSPKPQRMGFPSKSMRPPCVGPTFILAARRRAPALALALAACAHLGRGAAAHSPSHSLHTHTPSRTLERWRFIVLSQSTPGVQAAGCKALQCPPESLAKRSRKWLCGLRWLQCPRSRSARPSSGEALLPQFQNS